MTRSRCAAVIVGASLAFASLAPVAALASATIYCQNGNCSGSGGNGDNGTNNGNNSSNNTINVNLPGLGSYGSQQSEQYASSRQIYNYSAPVGLPALAPLGCGSRASAYAGFTGAPVAGLGSNMAFGVGLMSPIGREPEICRPQAVYAPPQASRESRGVQSSGQVPMSADGSRYVEPAQAPPTEAASRATSAAERVVTGSAVPASYARSSANGAPPAYVAPTAYAAGVPAAYAAPIVYAAPATFVGTSTNVGTTASAETTANAGPASAGSGAAVTVAERSPEARVLSAASHGSVCSHLDTDVANFFARDLRAASKSADSGRIVRDIRMLDDACDHAFVARALKK